MGQKGSSDTLLTCFGYASPSFPTDLPHCTSSDTALQFPIYASSAADPRFAKQWHGMNVAFTDGSVSWVPSTSLWSMGDGAVWYYYCPK